MTAEAEPGADGGRGRLRPDPEQHHRRQHRRQAAPRSGSRSSPRCSSSSGSRTCIGFLPLPTNTENKSTSSGSRSRRSAIYAATANISIPLVLTLVVWISYHVEGIRAKGFFRYLRSWLPPGLEDMNPFGKALIFVIEAISHFARLISLSVRLFANILAGHLLLLFMGGGLAVLLGLAALGAPHLPAGVLLLHPRGRPDRHPSGVHLLHPHRHLPRRGDRRDSLEKGAAQW